MFLVQDFFGMLYLVFWGDFVEVTAGSCSSIDDYIYMGVTNIVMLKYIYPEMY